MGLGFGTPLPASVHGPPDLPLSGGCPLFPAQGRAGTYVVVCVHTKLKGAHRVSHTHPPVFETASKGTKAGWEWGKCRQEEEVSRKSAMIPLPHLCVSSLSPFPQGTLCLSDNWNSLREQYSGLTPRNLFHYRKLSLICGDENNPFWLILLGENTY